MSRLFDGDNDRIAYTAGAVINAAPLTMACWFKRTHSASGIEEVLMLAAAAGATNQTFEMGLDGTDHLIGVTRTSAQNQATSTGTITDTNWHHAVFVTASATSRFVYLDGVKSTENTSSRTPTAASITAFFMGGHTPSTPTLEFFGNIAYAAVWSSALSDGNVASLYNSGAGALPNTVASGTLVAYWPLTSNTNPEPDDQASFDLTTSASSQMPAFSSDNPFGTSSDTALQVDSGTAVIEASVINLLDNSSYTLSVSNASVVAEAQAIPFQMTSSATEGVIAVAGQSVNLLFAETFSLSVTSASAVTSAETITLNAKWSLAVTSADAVFEGQDISGAVPFITAAGGASRRRAARMLMNFGR